MRNTIAVVAVLGLVEISMLWGQPGRSVWDGVYSPAQAVRGAALYGTLCSSCHGDDLEGTGQMPGLTGADFRKEWDGQAAGDLFERMKNSMPADKPGSLTREQNADILAFLLKTNGYPAGSADLKNDVDSLKAIRMLQKR